MTVTGWSWEYIDERMTLPRLYGMNRYWKRCPPAHIVLKAAFLKEKPQDDKPKTFEDFIRDFTGQGGRIDGVKDV